jgi:glycosyltransferase involved in cell wall biosynthesis
MANDKDPVWGLAGYRIDINGYRISRLDGALYGYGLARCDLVVTQTEAQRQVLRQARNLESVVVHNMISCTNNSTRPVPPTVVLWAANFRPVKRPEIMLRVAEKLPHLRFVMIGGPKIGYEALYRECERRAAGMANVDFRGPLPFAETEKYFSEAFVLLLTSASEGFPNVLLQAWAHGTPVVSTFDPDGLIQKHGLGYYCHTVEEIVARIQELVSDSALRNDMGKRAREYVAANHSVEVIMPRVEHMFEDLLR